MRKFLKIAVLPAFAVAMFAIVPALASAGAGLTPAHLPPTAGTGECQTSSQPTPPPGSSLGQVPGAGSEPWVHNNQAAPQAGIKGGRGYLVVAGNSTAQSVTVRGYQNSNESDVNGNASVTPNGTQKANACVSAQNQKVTIAAP